MKTHEKIMLFMALVYAAEARFNYEFGQGNKLWAGLALLWQLAAIGYGIKSAIEEWEKP